MQVVLLRVGIDTGSGGIHGPLFSDRSFEYIPIPDRFGGKGVDKRTYGNTRGSRKQSLVDYFPEARREKVSGQSIHFDPEFETFTYGDPTPPKAKLSEGSLLVFYAGLKGRNFDCPPALYIIGFFEVQPSFWELRLPASGIQQRRSLERERRKSRHYDPAAMVGDMVVQGNCGPEHREPGVRSPPISREEFAASRRET